MRIANNHPRNSHPDPLLKKVIVIVKSNILKFEDKILIENIIFLSKSINNLLSPLFKIWLIIISQINNYDTVSLSTVK